MNRVIVLMMPGAGAEPKKWFEPKKQIQGGTESAQALPGALPEAEGRRAKARTSQAFRCRLRLVVIDEQRERLSRSLATDSDRRSSRNEKDSDFHSYEQRSANMYFNASNSLARGSRSEHHSNTEIETRFSLLNI